MKKYLIMLFLLILAGCAVINTNKEKTILFKQKKVIHKVGNGSNVTIKDDIIKVEVNQKTTTPLKISAWIKTKDIAGPTGSNLLIVTNINYQETPVFWDTILYPQTGTHPWQYCEKYIYSRLPVKSLEIHFRLTNTKGQAWFRDFTVETVAPWQESDECVVVLLGDSTDMCAYIEDSQKLHMHLERLLRDRFYDTTISVRNLSESGDYLQQLLESGRLNRELKTLERCDVMIIRYGINDTWKNILPMNFKSQLELTCDVVLRKFPDAKIVLATTIPATAEQMDKQVRIVAAQRKYPCIDISTFLAKETSIDNSNWHTGKGTSVGYSKNKKSSDNPTVLEGNPHPNMYGSRLIAEAEFRVIESIIEEILSSSLP